MMLEIPLRSFGNVTDEGLRSHWEVERDAGVSSYSLWSQEGRRKLLMCLCLRCCSHSLHFPFFTALRIESTKLGFQFCF